MLFLLVGVSVAAPVSRSVPPPIFYLCPTNVEAAMGGEAPDCESECAVVHVELTPDAAQELRRFSKNSLGKTAELRLDGLILSRTPIQAVIDSGKIILGPWAEQRVAETIINLLSDDSLAVPCGSQQPQ